MSTNLKDLDAPYYDLIVEMNGGDEPSKRAEILLGDPLFFRCTVNGETSEEPSLLWVKDGSPILDTEDDKLIETKATPVSSTLRIARFETNHRGQYECSVKDKTGIRKKRKLNVDVKSANYTTLFNEELCTSNHEEYCKHNGICLMHKQSHVISCRCQPSFYGDQCQFVAQDHTCTKADCHKPVIIFGCVTALAILSLFVCLLFLMRHKSKKDRQKASDEEDAKPSALNNFIAYSPLPNGRPSFTAISKEDKILLPQELAICSNCGRQFDVKEPKMSKRSMSHLNTDTNRHSSPSSHSDSMHMSSIEQQPLDPNCVLCVAESKKLSLPGYLRVSDADKFNDESQQRAPIVSTLPKRARRLGQSDEERAKLALPKKSLSSPVTPVGSTRRLHESTHAKHNENKSPSSFKILTLDQSPKKPTASPNVSTFASYDFQSSPQASPAEFVTISREVVL